MHRPLVIINTAENYYDDDDDKGKTIITAIMTGPPTLVLPLPLQHFLGANHHHYHHNHNKHYHYHYDDDDDDDEFLYLLPCRDSIRGWHGWRGS